MDYPKFTFTPKWKEELVCSCSQGGFIIEMTMGVDGIYFPTENKWKTEAPNWTLIYWDSIRAQLSSWCEKNKIPLYVDESAWVQNQA